MTQKRLYFVRLEGLLGQTMAGGHFMAADAAEARRIGGEALERSGRLDVSNEPFGEGLDPDTVEALRQRIRQAQARTIAALDAGFRVVARPSKARPEGYACNLEEKTR